MGYDIGHASLTVATLKAGKPASSADATATTASASYTSKAHPQPLLTPNAVEWLEQQQGAARDHATAQGKREPAGNVPRATPDTSTGNVPAAGSKPEANKAAVDACNGVLDMLQGFRPEVSLWANKCSHAPAARNLTTAPMFEGKCSNV